MLLGMNNTTIFGKSKHFWKLNYTILNNIFIKENITHERTKYFKISDNKSKVYQSLWDPDKIVLRRNI